MNVADAIYVHARERPDHPAVEDGDRVVTYAELAILVTRAAAALRARGIGAGDIVVIALPDTAEHVVTLYAVAKIGAVSLSTDEKSSERNKSNALRDLTVKAAIVSDDSAGFLDLPAIAIGTLFEGHGEAEAPSSSVAFDADSPLMVIQSSGTTGEPKRFFVTHRRMAERNRHLIALLGLTPADRYLQVPYLRFTAGRRRTFAMLMLGATVVLNHAGAVAEYSHYFSERGITYVFLTPFHLRVLLAGVTSDVPLWPELKIAVTAAPIMPAERLLTRKRLTPQTFESYGTNEVNELAWATPADQDLRPDAVGRLVDGIEAQVVDANDRPLPFGETGEIGFRGADFPREYFGHAEATARHFRNGWFYPGDLAALSEDGYIFLKGRTDDVINNSGAKYFPAELEAVLITHPSVTDAAVIGGPHARFGEASVAYVVRSAKVTPKDLYHFCEGKIAMYKAPNWVFFLDEIPRVATGKPDKKKLKAVFRDYLATRPR